MQARVDFPPGTRPAEFVLREKRFRVQVVLRGEGVWVHTNNSGSMLGLLRPGQSVLVSPATNPARKLAWTLEAVRLHGFWCSVNTLAPNRMLAAAFAAGAIPELARAQTMRPEAKVGDSRLDARFDGPGGTLWVEAKNVTMSEYCVASFPDAVSVRGQKHLKELTRLARKGVRVAGFYLVSRADAACFGPADFIDPDYARLFYEAHQAGVMCWPHRALVDEAGVTLGERLPLAPAP